MPDPRAVSRQQLLALRAAYVAEHEVLRRDKIATGGDGTWPHWRRWFLIPECLNAIDRLLEDETL